MSVNDQQVGGTHYKTRYEHWDMVIDTGMGYFEGQASKYITRWRYKNGVEDLQKARHFITKLLERMPGCVDGVRALPVSKAQLVDVLGRYYAINKLSPLEQAAVTSLAFWTDAANLNEALDAVDVLIFHQTEPEPVPLTEENHYADRYHPAPPDDQTRGAGPDGGEPNG